MKVQIKTFSNEEFQEATKFLVTLGYSNWDDKTWWKYLIVYSDRVDGLGGHQKYVDYLGAVSVFPDVPVEAFTWANQW